MVRIFGKLVAPAGVLARYPAFDVTPAGLVTAIVTERGVLRAPGWPWPPGPPPVRSGVRAQRRTPADSASPASPARREVVSIGLRNTPLRDLYHSLLTTTWSQFFGLVLAAYLGANLIFASGYLAIGDGIEEARPGNFSDAFFFSVQTMATIRCPRRTTRCRRGPPRP